MIERFRMPRWFLPTLLGIGLAGCGGAATPASSPAGASPPPASAAGPASAASTASSVAAKPAAAQSTAAVPSAASGAKQLTKVQFMMPFIPPIEFSYWVVAQEKGFYADEGLDVTVNEGTSSGNAVKVVGAGNYAVGLADAIRIVAGRAQDVPVTSVMTLYYTSPVSVLSLKEKNITKLSDLIGKKMGGSIDGASILMWRVAMTKAGLDPNKVNFVGLDPAAQVAALVKGQVDAITAQTQPADLEFEGVANNTVPLGLDVVADSVFVNDSYLQKNPDAIRAFTKASIKGVQFVKDQPAETQAIMVKKFPTVEPKKLDLYRKLEATWVWTPNTPADKFGLQSLASWGNLQDLLLETKMTEKKVDISSFVTNKYLPYN
jgi:NitT/TauT family transport system substrate-binding protein